MSDLSKEYSKRYEEGLIPLSLELQEFLKRILAPCERIDRISVRAKSPDRFLTKAVKIDDDGKEKYPEPLSQIQDQIGARVITFYKSDVEKVSAIIERYFRKIESKSIVPESQWRFGYFGKHFILFIPSDFIDSENGSDVPPVFELQIKTLFQHAWSEANHDLGYKPELGGVEEEDVRKLALSSAQAWGADQIFEELSQKVMTRTESV